jgi:regulator of replication initiation timing
MSGKGFTSNLTVAELLQENEKLRNENNILQNQLDKYRRVFKKAWDIFKSHSKQLSTSTKNSKTKVNSILSLRIADNKRLFYEKAHEATPKIFSVKSELDRGALDCGYFMYAIITKCKAEKGDPHYTLTDGIDIEEIDDLINEIVEVQNIMFEENRLTIKEEFEQRKKIARDRKNPSFENIQQLEKSEHKMLEHFAPDYDSDVYFDDDQLELPLDITGT